MDPNATLAILIDPDTDRAERSEAWENLWNWLSKGGFPPKSVTLPAMPSGRGSRTMSYATKNFETTYIIEDLPFGGMVMYTIDKDGEISQKYSFEWTTK